MAQGIGGLLKTTNGGRTWRGVSLRGIPPGNDELSIDIAVPYFVSATQGFIHVHNSDTFGFGKPVDSTLYRTIDGGATWSQVFRFPVPDPEPKNFFRLVDDRTGFGVGSDDDMGAVFTTENHGSDWTQVGSLGSACEGEDLYTILDVYFLDPQHGWASIVCSKPNVSRTGQLAQTTDGGKTWKTVNLIHYDRVYFSQLSFINPNVGYIRQSTGELFVTHDGGAHLTLVAKNINYLWAMRFADEQRGWIGDGPNIYITHDGGKTWQRLAQPAAAESFGVLRNGDAWLVSVKGALFFLNQKDDLWTKYIIWGIGNGIQFADRLHGWGISKDAIYYTQDGGTHWVQVRRRDRGR